MERRSVLIASLIAFAIVVGTDVLYVGVINIQGESERPYIPRFVAGYLAVMSALILIALLPRTEIAQIRGPMRAAAAGGLLVLGFLSAFSIGLPLVLAGIVMTFALGRTLREPRHGLARLSGLAAAVLAVTVLIAGLEVTERVIECPASGQVSGGGSGFFTGSYQYECVNGVAHFHSG